VSTATSLRGEVDVALLDTTDGPEPGPEFRLLGEGLRILVGQDQSLRRVVGLVAVCAGTRGDLVLLCDVTGPSLGLFSALMVSAVASLWT